MKVLGLAIKAVDGQILRVNSARLHAGLRDIIVNTRCRPSVISRGHGEVLDVWVRRHGRLRILVQLWIEYAYPACDSPIRAVVAKVVRVTHCRNNARVRQAALQRPVLTVRSNEPALCRQGSHPCALAGRYQCPILLCVELG
eukprot:2060123-Prymnesium_polylepis.1